MIKCNVTINGIVSRTASMRTNKEGKSYIGFAVKTTIPAKAGGCKQVEIFVSKDGTDAELPSYVAGQRIGLKGVLTFRKREENLYLNFHAESVDFLPENERDAIEGTIKFGVRWANRWRKRETRGAIPTGYSLPSARRSTRKTFPLHGCASSVLPLKKMVGSTLKHVSVPKECWNSPYIWTKSTSPAGWRK
ncbi:hypothetical protein NXX35_26635 [Bacteroides xylanisolvens]|nr:hypothetical protein NXX35_26635 [Bacteroides xylanisolvens]